MIGIIRNSMVETLLYKKENYLLSDYDSPILNHKNHDIDYLIWINFLLPDLVSNNLDKQIESLRDNLLYVASNYPKKKKYILGLFRPSYFSLNSDLDVDTKIFEFNQFIRTLAQEDNSIILIEPKELLAFLGPNFFDPKFYFSASSYISPKYKNSFSNWLDSIHRRAADIKAKLLILDLDNTLWGGVLGEDGPNGIAISNNFPGNIYLEIQSFVKKISLEGILLGICSKNNLSDVEEVFKKNKNLILDINDFVAIKANWNPKSQNIAEMAHDLNLGLDSFVFIDDNPVERAEVMNSHPMVITPEFPDQTTNLPIFFYEVYLRYFKADYQTLEDLNKREQYALRERSELEKNKFNSQDEFLKSLSMLGIVNVAPSEDLERISQMTIKTNQFNLNTYRMSIEEVKSFFNDGNFIFSFSLKDKFGDHGITGVFMAKKDDTVPHRVKIINFLLSCRILGRDAESSFLRKCLDILQDRGVKEVFSAYNPTHKNIQTKNFYEDFGFTILSSTKDATEYSINLRDLKSLKYNSIIEVNIL